MCGTIGGTITRCAYLTACCVGSAACMCCCRGCPDTTNSSATRTAYAIIFFVFACVSWVFMDQDIGSKLGDMEDETGTVLGQPTGVDCDQLNSSCDRRWSQLAVYRIMFSLAIFHFAFTLFTFRVKNSKDCRAGLHNGFWFLKSLVLVGTVIGSFFIDNDFFSDKWSYVAIVGSVIFLLLQSTFIVTLSGEIAESFKNDDGTIREGTQGIQTMISFTCYICVIILTAVLYRYFSCSGNDTPGALISVNVAFVVVMLLISCKQSVRSGIVTPSIVSFYMTYLTWSAVSETNDLCELPGDVVANDVMVTLVGLSATVLFIMGISRINRPPQAEVNRLIKDVESKKGDPNAGAPTNTVVIIQKVADDEESGCVYNWSMFHFLLACGSLYVTNIITDWARVDDGEEPEFVANRGGTSVWVQIIMSWIAGTFYIIYAAAPLMCPNKDFSPQRSSSHQIAEV